MTSGVGSHSPLPALETQLLAKRFGRSVALEGLTMRVPPAEVFGFLGPNGAGKTTAVKLLLGLSHPTSGSATVLGRPCGDLDTRRRIGYLPELFRYQGWLTGQEVLGLHARLAGLTTGSAGDITEALDSVGLAGRGTDRVATYSKGMQQRLGLAVALLGRPELVFLDEPTSALDPVGRAEVRQLIRRLRARGTTVFLNSHLLSEVEQICDRVAIVSRGRVAAAGTMDELVAGDVVRVRATGLTREARSALREGRRSEDDGEWLVFRGLAREAVPEVVTAIVASGGRVYAAESRGQTLEDRFRELVGEDPRA